MASPRLSEGAHPPALRPLAGRFTLVGHRGARGLFPENTVPAFLGALDAGATGLELDVHVAGDGVVVVCHDPWVDAAGTRVAVRSLPAHELSRLDVGTRPDPSFPDRRSMAVGIPTLDDVFGAVAAAGARPEWFVEVKSTLDGEGSLHPEPGAFADATAGVIDQHGLAGRTTIMSFDPRILVALRNREPRISLMLLVEEGSPMSLEAHVDRLGFAPDGIGPHWSLVTAAAVSRAHEAGMRVLPWTVNEGAQARLLVSMGVDGLTTDRPDLLLEVLDPEPGPAREGSPGS